jgi:chromosome partitioning protein
MRSRYTLDQVCKVRRWRVLPDLSALTKRTLHYYRSTDQQKNDCRSLQKNKTWRIIGLLSYKGGQAKTTSAIHLAGYLSRQATTCLIDCDLNRSALAWADKGGLPFEVVDEAQTARAARRFEHLVIDTKARPGSTDLEAMAANCDALVIPCTPDRLALDALRLTLDALGRLDPAGYRVLLTICPPRPSRDADDTRATLRSAGLPVFEGSYPERSLSNAQRWRAVWSAIRATLGRQNARQHTRRSATSCSR